MLFCVGNVVYDGITVNRIFLVNPVCAVCSLQMSYTAVQSRAVPLGTKANFKMAAGLLFLTFFAFHGTSGNQTENNVNIFLIVKLFDWTFCLLPQNHISLIDVAAVGTIKNYVMNI